MGAALPPAGEYTVELVVTRPGQWVEVMAGPEPVEVIDVPGVGAGDAAFPTTPVDQEIFGLALSRGMDGDPRDGRSAPAPEDPLAHGSHILVFPGVAAEQVDLESAEIVVLVPVLGKHALVLSREDVTR